LYFGENSRGEPSPCGLGWKFSKNFCKAGYSRPGVMAYPLAFIIFLGILMSGLLNNLRRQKMKRKDSFDLFQGLVFLGLAIIPILDSIGWKLPETGKLLIVIFCALFYTIIAVVKINYNTEKLLIEGSEPYFNFFKEWYSRPGKLSIFCSGLDWMIKKPFDLNLIDTICEKGDNCKVYLRGNITPEIKRKLEEKNVKISLNNNLLTKHRFSLLEDENSSFLIISDKKNGDDMDDNTIVIKKETNSTNPYIITVVKDLLDSMDGDDKNAR
jgi:hypothetical protein